MAKRSKPPRISSAPGERRRHPRKKMGEVSYVDLLDAENGGLVLDISAAGMMLQFALRVREEEISRLRFRLPASDQWIEARAQLVWVGKSGKEAGARFLDMAEESRSKIEEWVANGDVKSYPPVAAEEGTSSRRATQEPAAPAASRPTMPPRNFAPGNRLSTTKFPWWGLGRVVMWLALILAVVLGFRYSPRWRRDARSARATLIDRFQQARSRLDGMAKTVQFPRANIETQQASQAATGSRGLSPQPLESHATPVFSPSGNSASSSNAPKSTESALRNMVTQSLSAKTAAQAQMLGRPHSIIHSSRSTVRVGEPRASHNTILVGAPAVGAPPARVILERGPVSATSRIAVMARRSILVPGSYHRTEELQLGKLASYVEPVYPARALAREIEGTVRLRAFIGRSGEVQSVRLLSGPKALAPAATRAIREWRYDQTLLDGRAIESQTDVSVFFRLH